VAEAGNPVFYFGGFVASVSVQQFLNANPALVIIALFVVGIIAVLAVRILLANASCLVHLGCAIVVIVAIILLLRLLLVR
jgi:uncharacterized membrane protein